MKKINKIIAMCLSLMIVMSSFSVALADNTVDSDVAVELDTVRLLGIINGDENGNLNLEKNVTRAEFVKMALSASVYKDSVNENSNLSVFSDVSSKHWAAGYIKQAVDLSWLTGYLDGTFKPNNNITLEEAATVILKMMGYQNSDLIGAFPYAQIHKFEALGLNKNMNVEKGQLLTRKDCVTIFYNLINSKTKNNTFYGASIGVIFDELGNVNYNALLNKEISQAVVYKTSIESAIPFTLTNISVYRDGLKTEINKIEKYDVLYFCENLRTIYAYSTKIFGAIDSFPGNNIYPDTINVAGNNYKVASNELSRKIIDQYGYKVGDSVVLLLGKNNDVIDAVLTSDMNVENVGIVTSATNKIIDGEVKYFINAMMIDGTSSSYTLDRKINLGDVVQISINNGKISVVKVYNLSKNIDYSDLANVVNILDVKENQSKKIYKSRLEDLNLRSENVKYYDMDSNGKINKLILNNFTNDFDIYGIVKEKQENQMGLSLSSQYQILTKGNMTSVGSNSAVYNVGNVPVVITKKNGNLDTMSELKEYTVDSLNDLNAKSAGLTLKYTDDMQVYLYGNNAYQLTTVSELMKSSNLTIKAYVNTNANISNEIRIIIAR